MSMSKTKGSAVKAWTAKLPTRRPTNFSYAATLRHLEGDTQGRWGVLALRANNEQQFRAAAARLQYTVEVEIRDGRMYARVVG